ncbi:hypothetical protein, partial [Pedobacter sp. UBA5917]|uniref:hypothetical protein n=1 Tax=Pedobacter sp. UBA5917 TaxID=1947061 RepID=UPI00260015FA
KQAGIPLRFSRDDDPFWMSLSMVVRCATLMINLSERENVYQIPYIEVVTLNLFQGLSGRKDTDHEVAIRPLNNNRNRLIK